MREAPPQCSILLGVYNQSRYLRDTVQSVLTQSWEDWELIVVDDGSTDGSASLVPEDPRIRVIQQPNGGQAAALNTAFTRARGAWIFLLDGDDCWLPDKLASCLAWADQHPEAAWIHHRMAIMDGAGRPSGAVTPTGTLMQGAPNPVLAFTGEARLSPTSGMGFRRELAQRLFPIPEAVFGLRADYYLQVAASASGLTLLALDRILAHYRVHDANGYTGPIQPRKLQMDREMVLWLTAWLNPQQTTPVKPAWCYAFVRSSLYLAGWGRRWTSGTHHLLTYASFSLKHSLVPRVHLLGRLAVLFCIWVHPEMGRTLHDWLLSRMFKNT